MDDNVVKEVARWLRRFGPTLGTLLALGALGSCGMVAAQALGFAPSTTGDRLATVEAQIDTLGKDRDTGQAIMADLLLLQCKGSQLNDTQRGICARWER